MVFALLVLSLAGAVSDEAGFGGADDGADVGGDVGGDADQVDIDVELASDLPPPTEFTTGAAAATTTMPEPVLRVVEPPKKSKLELELEKARIDPAGFPLVQLRVDVARLELQLQENEERGLTAARGTEQKLAEARALLADAERIALHRMAVCAARIGKGSSVKNFRMTAGGPVRLTTREVLAQTSALDPDGCARIELLDQAVVDRLRRAHDIQITLSTVSFPYHRIAERRALEDELAALRKLLAREDLPVLTVAGAKDPYGR